jgi:hypothetical protein
MFNMATAFNQNIGNWDVSRGAFFVSNDHDVQFTCLALFSWIQRQMHHDLQPLNKKQVYSSNLVFHYFLMAGIYVLWGICF